MATLDLFKKITINNIDALVVRSDAIEVFPTANRGINHETNLPINLESRLQTEYNLTILGDTKNYIDKIHNFANGGNDAFISFYLDGYHFKIYGISESLLHAKLTPTDGINIYASIKFKETSITTGQNTKILASFKTISNEVANNVVDNCLDTDDGYFYGLILTNSDELGDIKIPLFKATTTGENTVLYKVSQDNWLPNIKAADYKLDSSDSTSKYTDNKKPTGISINNNIVGEYAFAEGYETSASGKASHAEGYNTTAIGEASHSEGYNTVANGDYSHVQGFNNSILTAVSNNHKIVFTKADPSPADLRYILISIDGHIFDYYMQQDELLKDFNFGAGTILTYKPNSSVSSRKFTIATASFKQTYTSTEIPVESSTSWDIEVHNQTYFIVNEYDEFESLFPYNNLEPRENSLIYEDLITFNSEVSGLNNNTIGAVNHIEGANNDTEGNYLHIEGNEHTVKNTFNNATHTIRFRKVSSNIAERDYIIYQIDNFLINEDVWTDYDSSLLPTLKSFFTLGIGSKLIDTNQNEYSIASLSLKDSVDISTSGGDYTDLLFSVDITDPDFIDEFPYIGPDPDDGHWAYYEITLIGQQLIVNNNEHIEGYNNIIQTNLEDSYSIIAGKLVYRSSESWILDTKLTDFDNFKALIKIANQNNCYIYNYDLKAYFFGSISYNIDNNNTLIIKPKRTLLYDPTEYWHPINLFTEGQTCIVYFTNKATLNNTNHIEGDTNSLIKGIGNHIEGRFNPGSSGLTNKKTIQNCYLGWVKVNMYITQYSLYLFNDSDDTLTLHFGDIISTDLDAATLIKTDTVTISAHQPYLLSSIISNILKDVEDKTPVYTSGSAYDEGFKNWVRSNGVACTIETMGIDILQTIQGNYNHIEGSYNKVLGATYSHIEGYNNIANGEYQHIFGKYNTPEDDKAEIVGGGYTNYSGSFITTRRNIRTLDWKGNEWIAGNLAVNGRFTGKTDLTSDVNSYGDANGFTSVGIPDASITDISSWSGISNTNDATYGPVVDKLERGCSYIMYIKYPVAEYDYDICNLGVVSLNAFHNGTQLTTPGAPTRNNGYQGVMEAYATFKFISGGIRCSLWYRGGSATRIPSPKTFSGYQYKTELIFKKVQ